MSLREGVVAPPDGLDGVLERLVEPSFGDDLFLVFVLFVSLRVEPFVGVVVDVVVDVVVGDLLLDSGFPPPTALVAALVAALVVVLESAEPDTGAVLERVDGIVEDSVTVE